MATHEKSDRFDEQKFDEIIAKFANGKDRYNKSAILNKVVKLLTQGADPLLIIDHLTIIIDNQQNTFEQYVNLGITPMLINPIL